MPHPISTNQLQLTIPRQQLILTARIIPQFMGMPRKTMIAAT